MSQVHEKHVTFRASADTRDQLSRGILGNVEELQALQRIGARPKRSLLDVGKGEHSTLA